MKKIVLLALLLTSAPVMAAQQFNLECSGTRTNFIRSVPGDPKDYKSTYHVDLDKGVWCEDECEATRPIFQVTDTMLHLDKVLPDAANSMVINRLISRKEGWEMTTIDMGPISMRYKGQCVPAAFTGFPKVKTAF